MHNFEYNVLFFYKIDKRKQCNFKTTTIGYVHEIYLKRFFNGDCFKIHLGENRPQLDDPGMTATELIDKINQGLFRSIVLTWLWRKQPPFSLMSRTN